MPIFPNIDLNLLRLLDTLYEERSVTRAAERLFLTPSAVSHGLGRLRRLLGDDLFVRAPHGMIPTPRAHEAAKRLRSLLPQLGEIIHAPAFDALATERVFAVACVPYLASILMPTLADRFAAAAPLARLDVQLMYPAMVDDLDSGALDLVLANFRKTPSRYELEEVIRDPYVWVMSRANARSGRKLTRRILAELPHVDLYIESATASPVDSYDARQGLERLVIQDNLASIDRELAKEGLRRHVRFLVPDSISAMALVSCTDAVSLVPSLAARKFADAMNLIIFEPPFRTDPLVIQMLHHGDLAHRPATQWLLNHVRASAAAIGATIVA